MPKKQKLRYRVMKFTLNTKLDSSTIEDWLNAATDEEYIHNVIKEGAQVILISAARRRPRYKRSKRVVTKKPAKKTT